MKATTTSLWLPYCGAAPAPADWLGRWNGDPILLVGIVALVIGWHRLARSGDLRWSTAAFALLTLLFVTPFCALTSALFSARAVHHVLLVAVVPLLTVRSLPPQGVHLRGALPLWTATQAITFWLWHAPPLYAAALSSDLVYWLMQASLLGTALGFWIALRRATAPAAVAALLFSMVQMGLLGALLTFAGAPLYAPHLFTTAPWGLSALEDQQLAGLIMWAPAAGLYLGAALFLTSRWLAREDAKLAR